MTLVEALRLYDINITVDLFLLYCLISLIAYGLIVGLWTWLIGTLEHFRTKRMFIKYELPRLHKRTVQKLMDKGKTKDARIKLLENEVEKYFVQLKIIDEARDKKGKKGKK